MSSAIKTPAFAAKAGNIQNEDNSSIYSGGEWSFKNASAVTGFHVDADGKVGIGTTSPSYKLDVAAGYARIARGIEYNASASVGIDLGATNADSVNNSATYAWGQEITGNATGQSLVFKRYRRADSTVEAMRLDGEGLWMNGIGIRYPGVGGSGTPNFVAFKWSGPNVIARIDNVMDVTLANVSDYRIKRNIESMQTPALERLAELRPVTYQLADYGTLFKASEEIKEGFIAHELQDVIPSAVEGEKDDEDQIQSLKLDALCAVMVKAIQELSAKVDAQAAEIEALKAK